MYLCRCTGAKMFAHTQFESFLSFFHRCCTHLLSFVYSIAPATIQQHPVSSGMDPSQHPHPLTKVSRTQKPGCMLNRLPSLPFPPICAILSRECAYSVAPHDCPIILAVLLVVVWRIVLPLTSGCPIIRKLAVTVRVWIIILPFLPKTYLHS